MDVFEFLTKDRIRGATEQIRDKQREKLADLYFDAAKFMVTGVAFGTVFTVAASANVSIVALVSFGLGALGACVLFVALGLRQLRRMEQR